GIRISGVKLAIRDFTVNFGTNSSAAGVIIDDVATDASLAGLAIKGNAGKGVMVSVAKMFRLERTLIDANTEGGVEIGEADFDIENNMIVRNGRGGPSGTTYGGVYLGSLTYAMS